MQVLGETKNWLRYWRNSLADAEGGKGVVTKKDLRSFHNAQVSVFQKGCLLDEPGVGENQLILNSLFEGEPEKTQLIKALVRPAIFISKYEHGQKYSSTRPDVVSPIICHVWISRCGQFYPAGRPTVPRDLLTPQAEDKFTLFDVDGLDGFHTAKEAQVFSEQEALTLVENEQDNKKRYKGWSNYCDLARDLFKTINVEETKLKLESGYQQESEKKAYIVKVDDVVNATRNILKLYDWLNLGSYDLALLDNYSVGQVNSYQPCLDSSSSVSSRLGHSNSKFSLTEAQRDALTHALNMSNGEILAVNGPPGTGKTTFVLSVVASLWIKAALEEVDPPIVIAASTNNQAVTNVIAAFGKDFEEDGSTYSGRWIPSIKSYGGYFPATSKEKEAAALYQTKAFYESLEHSDVLDRSEAAFIERAQSAFGDKALETVESIKNILHREMTELHSQLSGIEQSWSSFTEAQDRCFERLGDKPYIAYGSSKEQLEIAEKELKKAIADQESWQVFSANESLWLLLFRWLPPVTRKLLLLRKVFIETTFSDVTKPVVQSLNCVDEDLSIWIEQKRKEVGQLKRSHSSLTLLIDQWLQAKQKWLAEALLLLPILSDVPLIKEVDSFLDVSLRFRLFQLSVHYWEARWLLECRSMEAKGKTDWAGHKKTGLKSVLPRWRRRMMLTPCIVSTLHSLPSHMTYKAHAGDQQFNEKYLVNEIDLLIVDEAGQVSPEIAAASFSLAKKALVIGDIHQIEPVRSLTGSIDRGNLVQYGVMSDKEQYPEISQTGGTVINGSVMHIAQRASRYHYMEKAEAGMFLREHRRCYDEIISFSNELCYQGLLLPRRGPAPNNNLFPAMAYLHIDGRAEAPPEGSRYNALEANQLVNWLVQNREKIESYYHQKDKDYQGKLLEDLVGVVTPFKAQQEKIERACAKQGIKTGKGIGHLTVGTVHAFQGAERPIVIFSAVYSRHADGDFIDMNASMLNVAVSRAKDSFIVFGDMDTISGARRGKPRHLLSSYLFSSDANEMIIAQNKRPDLLRPTVTPRLINNAEEHDNYIKQVLKKAESQVYMVSPWISIQRLKESGLYIDMVKAVKRGVVVSLFSDYHFNSTSMNKFDESKAMLFKKACEQLSSEGISVYVVDSVHSKLIMADRRFLSVGSFNWCSASRTGKYVNMETSMIYTGDLGDEIALQVKHLRSRVRKSYGSEKLEKTSNAEQV